MGQSNVWMDWFKLHDDLKTKFIEVLMLIYIFLSVALCKGGGFTTNTAKRCLFRLIEPRPVECLF